MGVFTWCGGSRTYMTVANLEGLGSDFLGLLGGADGWLDWNFAVAVELTHVFHSCRIVSH